MKSLDFYRSVHKDFTESTHCGSLISVVATVVLAALFVLEVRSFINVPIATEVIMDSAPDGSELQINFDFLMPDLVCQFASVDVQDIMGTDRQGITKNIVMQRVDAHGNRINVDYLGDSVLEYEVATEEPSEHDCTVTMYGGQMYDGWKLAVQAGRYLVGELENKVDKFTGKTAWKNDELSSIKVAEGCVAIVYEHGDYNGWHAILPPGEYSMEALVNNGGKDDDVSSMVVISGSEQDANAAHRAIEEDHTNAIKRETHELDAETFDPYIKDPKNHMVVVDFYAPWCHWCQLLEPTWKQVARTLPEKGYSVDTRITKVNCETNRQLCMDHNIRGYPTVNVYMAGSTKAEETYYGDRTVEAFFAWIEHEHKVIEIEVKNRNLDNGGTWKETPGKEKVKGTGDSPTHLRLKGDKGKLIGIEGCTMRGYVEVKRVPGNFHVQFSHKSYNFENSLINASHHINHFSFGTPLPKATRKWIDYIDQKVVADHLADRGAATMDSGTAVHALMMGSNNLDDMSFLSGHSDRTYEHFIQIVPVIYRSRRGLEISTYKYSVTSAEHEDSDSFPSARFNFALSPMAIVMAEEPTPWYHFLTNMCAIIGGLFTVFSLVASFSNNAIEAFKAGMGKQS